MEVCSLEDDEYGNMFITQESRNIVPLVSNLDAEVEMDLGSDVLEIGKGASTQYSDISDVEDFHLPSSQQRPVQMWVIIILYLSASYWGVW